MGINHRFLQLLVAGPLLYSLGLALQADIRADSNRDGYVDLHGESDLLHKLEWNTEGALFMPNIKDSCHYCYLWYMAGLFSRFEDFVACNDASADQLWDTRYLTPLATSPVENISHDAWGTVEVHEEIARKNVRIFQDDQTLITNDHRFSSAELRKGLNLGIDARDTRRPGGWDGRVEVHFNIQDGNEHSDDFVRLRVAPLLLSHSLQPVKFLELVDLPETTPPNIPQMLQKSFNDQFESILNSSNSKTMPEIRHMRTRDQDQWYRDFASYAYISKPGPNGGSTVLPIVLRSSQESREGGKVAIESTRSFKGAGAIYSPGGTRDEINSMGNVMTIPPYRIGSKHFPAGRVIVGSHGSQNPHILGYLRAQELQDPLILDSDWLAIGHLDEFLQFVPVREGKSLYGWALLIADPNAGLDILTKACNDGHGSALVFSRGNESEQWMRDGPVPGYSIDELLGHPNFTQSNRDFAKRIEKVQLRLMKETGLRETDIYKLPMLFQTGICWKADRGVSPERNCSTSHATSLHPAVVNGVPLDQSHFVAPHPWGPVVEGVDILEKSINDTFRDIGMNGGQVYSGTNSFHNATQPWWGT
ncbi:arginine deiminase type-3 [Aspergillus campestris IBT 28561]|uniref:Arginine deiminase type-3 n=1 Tax=Aspergillus campestris (strain IBT 28561) TaxID=1392248 RepID=A0A2I1CS57_ASPC2|nr:arginine deiminase type-3 [Aspergillus campestris IBT 28561]PKY00448.1 arginine deiminase type-3 [Aspergillus campestris IBT 28561]